MIKYIVFACIFSCSFLYAESGKKELSSETDNFVKEIPMELTSENGMKFWFLHDENSKLVHVRIAFTNCGSAYLQKTKAGTAALYSETVFCGAGKYSKQEFEKQCHDNSIKISCFSGVDNLRFSMTTSELVLQDAVKLLNTMLIAPRFDEKEILRIQGAFNFNEVTMSALLPAKLFKSHAYERGAVGAPEDYVKLTAKDLKEYQRRFIVRKNAKVFVCGEMTEQQAKSLVDKIFSNMPDGKEAPDTLKNVSPQLTAKVDKYYQEGPQSKILFALKGEEYSSKKRCAAMLVSSILGNLSFMRNRILMKLRTEQGLIYSGYVVPLDMKHAHIVYGVLQTDNKKAETAIASLKAIIKDLREKGVTQEELSSAKSNFLGSLLVGLRTSAALSQFYFQNMIVGRGVNFLRELVTEINRLQLSDVNALAKELPNEDNLSIIVIGGNA